MNQPPPDDATRTHPPRAAEDTVHRGASGTRPDLGDRPPDWIGEYRVVRKLGEGGMGAVYLARDERLGREVAVKTLKPALAASPTDRERFLREARAAAQIHHDHAVPILHIGEFHGGPYLVMPFLAGETLDDRLKRESVVPPALVLKVAHEVAEGLGAAHAKGLIHRDIKPANVWLEADPGGAERCRILDFGLARSVASDDAQLTTTGAIMGTPAYMAPEQARGDKLDPRADLFSLGTMLYRLATGHLPFRGANTLAVLIALGTDTPTPVRELNPAVPPAVADLIEWLLNKNPDARPQRASDVAALARSLADGLASGVLPVPAVSSRRLPALPPGLEATTASLHAVRPPTAPALVAGRPSAAPLTEIVLVPILALALAVPWAAAEAGSRWALPVQALVLTSVLAWGLLAVGRLPAPRTRFAPLQRALHLLFGLGAGALAFWAAGWSLPADAAAVEVVQLGSQTYASDALSAAVRYVLFFGLALVSCRWWLATDPARRWRVPPLALLEVAAVGVLLLVLWPWEAAPLLFGVAVLAGAGLIASLLAPRAGAA